MTHPFRIPGRALPRLAALPILTALLLGGCSSMPPPEMAPPNEPAQTSFPAGEPDWRVGDRWNYSDGYGLKVTAVDDDGIATLTRTDNGERWTRRRGLFVTESQSGEIHRQVIYRSTPPETLFPLAVERTVAFQREFLTDGALRTHETAWSVLRRESIEVPAGRFDCWVVEWRTRSLTSDWEGYERWWYYPPLKSYVRLEFQYGDTPPSSRVLMDYELAPEEEDGR